jgi:hypothetical protein
MKYSGGSYFVSANGSVKRSTTPPSGLFSAQILPP